MQSAPLRVNGTPLNTQSFNFKIDLTPFYRVRRIVELSAKAKQTQEAGVPLSGAR